jgi:hypothetical protein
MKAAMKKPTPRTNKRGPEPERLKIEGDWKEAIKKSFQKKRPANGWPQ